MVKKVNKIDKKKYKKDQSKPVYLFVSVAVIVIVALAWYLGMGSSSTALVGPAPKGNNCPENVAYIQRGVDKYIEITGEMPTDVEQLTQTVDGKGPFVERIPPCPSGNIYLINNGIVVEASR